MSENKKRLTIWQKIKRTPQFLFDFLVVCRWAFYDMFLALKVNENESYVDIYVMTKSEKRFMFPHDTAGGYAGFHLIKFFVLPNIFLDEVEASCEIINHEILHRVLANTISWEARQKLDKVQKFAGIYNIDAGKWTYRIIFAMIIKGKLVSWID